MVTLALERSTDTPSVALAEDGRIAAAEILKTSDARSADWPLRVKDFLAARRLTWNDVAEFLVGQGPGSFAGIRAALAFVQGLALPEGKTVKGLPSSAALARPAGVTAVVGDARRGRFWTIVYRDRVAVRDFTLVSEGELAAAVPEEAVVTTPDGARIGETLARVFGARYAGSETPLAGNLLAAALAAPASPVPEPLPVYLSPAVRPAAAS